MTLSVLDIMLLAAVLALVVHATLSGFVSEFFSRAAVLAGLSGGILLARGFAPSIARLTGADRFTEAVSFLVIFLVFYLAVKIVQQLVGSVIQGDSLVNLDRALGFFLGLVEACVFVLLVLMAIRTQPWFDLSWMTRDSLLDRVFDRILSEGRFAVPDLSQFR
jgi:Uncharacterized membrane protein, required for colicin V production